MRDYSATDTNEDGRLIAGIRCREVAAHLSEYYDSELLDDKLCRRIEEHVAGCDNCEAVLNTFTKTIELYKNDSESEEMPEESRRKLHVILHIDELLGESGKGSPGA